MRIMFAAILASMFVTLAAGCPMPDPQPPAPAVDGGEDLDASRASCAGACSNLEKLGCPVNDCEVTCTKSQGTLTDLHPACLARARTKEAARACGSVRCLLEIFDDLGPFAPWWGVGGAKYFKTTL